MLDNKAQSEVASKILRDADYSTKVMIFDLNCGSCPHVQYIVTATAPYTGRPTEFDCGVNLKKALHIANIAENGGLKRRCSLNDASMNEVVMNGCRFWKGSTCESGEDCGEFIEVQDVSEWQTIK